MSVLLRYGLCYQAACYDALERRFLLVLMTATVDGCHYGRDSNVHMGLRCGKKCTGVERELLRQAITSGRQNLGDSVATNILTTAVRLEPFLQLFDNYHQDSCRRAIMLNTFTQYRPLGDGWLRKSISGVAYRTAEAQTALVTSPGYQNSPHLLSNLRVAFMPRACALAAIRCHVIRLLPSLSQPQQT